MKISLQRLKKAAEVSRRRKTAKMARKMDLSSLEKKSLTVDRSPPCCILPTCEVSFLQGSTYFIIETIRYHKQPEPDVIT